jgi:hypothetical protein
VEEMMAVTGTVVRSENDLVPMQQMEHYEELWQVSQVLHSYNTICDFLSFHKQVWKVLPYRSAAPWKPHCNKNDASAKGWLPLLVSLEDARVIEPIRWNQFPVLVKASDPRCQDSLNRMLDAYCNADVNTRRQLKLSFKSEDPDAVCVLENLNLTFDKTLPVQERNQVYQLSFSADGPRYLTLPEFSTGLQELHKSGLIHPINQDPFLTNTHIQPGNVPAVHIRFRYADLGAMDCLTKAGNALEALAYHTIRKMDMFDDVKLGVSILWGEQIEPGTPTQNEIDLVCIKGNRSFFISCKKTRKILPAHITEIRYETDRFGVNGTAILLTTAPENSNKAAYNRARHMGVEIITLRDDGTQDSARELRRQIKLILKKYCM